MKKNIISLLFVAAFSFLYLQSAEHAFAGTSDIKNTPVQSNPSFDVVMERARKGEAKTEFTLGLMYTKAAEQGYADAQLNLGLCYVAGEGVAVNKMEAYKWWSKAAQQGNQNAKQDLDLLGPAGPFEQKGTVSNNMTRS